MCHILFIHSSVDGHLGCFHLLAFVNSAAVNAVVQISLRAPAFSSFGCVPMVELLDPIVALFFIFWGAAMLFSMEAVPFCIPADSAHGFQFKISWFLMLGTK